MTEESSGKPFQRVRDFLRDACGIALSADTRALVEGRLLGVVAARELGSLAALVDRLEMDADAGLREAVIEALTSTGFSGFGTGAHWLVLEELMLPELAERLRRPIQVWSSACGGGEDAYAISICYEEWRRAQPDGTCPELEILGTDLSPRLLENARSGAYERSAIEGGLGGARLRRYFEPAGERWRVRPEVGARVRFGEFNLLRGPVAGQFDAIFCRDVLIYFSGELKRDILRRLTQALYPRGYLLLGESESLPGAAEHFEPLRHRAGLVYRLK